MKMATDYTYEYREDLDTYTYRQFFVSMPQIYADGDTLEAANAAFRDMVQTVAEHAITAGWIKLNITMERNTN